MEYDTEGDTKYVSPGLLTLNFFNKKHTEGAGLLEDHKFSGACRASKEELREDSWLYDVRELKTYPVKWYIYNCAYKIGKYRVSESMGMDKLIQADFRQEVLRSSVTKHWHLQVK